MKQRLYTIDKDPTALNELLGERSNGTAVILSFSLKGLSVRIDCAHQNFFSIGIYQLPCSKACQDQEQNLSPGHLLHLWVPIARLVQLRWLEQVK